MKFGNKRREYLADTFGKIAEFVISILVIGYLISTKLNPEVKLDLVYLLIAGIIAIMLITIGAWLLPEKED